MTRPPPPPGPLTFCQTNTGIGFAAQHCAVGRSTGWQYPDLCFRNVGNSGNFRAGKGRVRILQLQSLGSLAQGNPPMLCFLKQGRGHHPCIVNALDISQNFQQFLQCRCGGFRSGYGRLPIQSIFAKSALPDQPDHGRADDWWKCQFPPPDHIRIHRRSGWRH